MKPEWFKHHIVDGHGIHIRHYFLCNKGCSAALRHGICTILAASKGAARWRTLKQKMKNDGYL